MSLAPSEQRTPTDIEARLRRSDPKLAARLALFRRHASRGPGPARELLSPWRVPRRRRAVWVLLIAAALAVTILSLALASPGGQPPFPAMDICGTTAAGSAAQPTCSPPGNKLPSVTPRSWVPAPGDIELAGAGDRALPVARGSGGLGAAAREMEEADGQELSPSPSRRPV